MNQNITTEAVPRRRFLRGAAATGLVVTGVAAGAGSTAAQNRQRLDIDASNIDEGVIVIENVSVLSGIDVDVGDITVEVLSRNESITLNVLSFNEDSGVIEVEVTDSLNNLLQDGVVRVVVSILSDDTRFVGRDVVR